MVDQRFDGLEKLLKNLASVEGGEREVLERQRILAAKFNALGPAGAVNPSLKDEFEDNQAYLLNVRAVRDEVVRYYSTEMGAAKDLIEGIGRKRLAKGVYSVTPVSVKGNDEHNNRVAQHINALNAAHLAEADDAKESELAKVAYVALLEEGTEEAKKLYDAKLRPYIEKETREALMKVMPDAIARNKALQLREDEALLRKYAKKGAEILRNQFEKSFANDGERADYAAVSLREAYKQASAIKDEDEKRETLVHLAKATYGLSK